MAQINFFDEHVPQKFPLFVYARNLFKLILQWVSRCLYVACSSYLSSIIPSKYTI